MDFDTFKQRKYDEGRRAHPNTPWDAVNVAWRFELKGELADAWWYADLSPNWLLKVVVQFFCRRIYNWLERGD